MNAVALVGGWAHPVEMVGPALAEALGDLGWGVTVVDSTSDAAASVAAGCDLVVVHCCRFQMLDARYSCDQRAAHAELTPDAWRSALAAHLAAGRPLLGLHTAPISFDDWAEWPNLLGARWNWDRSGHPPPGPFTVDLADGASFEVVDELYRFVEPTPGAELLATATDAEGIVQPLVWRHRAGPARVAYDALGHDARSLAHPAHRDLLGRLLAWLTEP